MSPRHFAKHHISPYFLSDPHFIDDRPKKVTLIGKFVNLFKSPAQNEEPETPAEAGGDQEIDLKQIRAAKQSNQ